jgi:hypothetical protein
MLLVYTQSVTAALWEDPAALMSDRVYFGAAGGVGILNGFVDYAVYAPGDYTGSISFSDDLYVYTYQVSNNSSSPVGIDYFSVGLFPNVQVPDVTYDPAMGYAIPGGSNPTMYFKLPESVIYLYQTDNIGAGEWSTVLLFSSNYGPEMAYGYVSGGVTGGASMELPSPVPEPATFALIGAGALLALRQRRIGGNNNKVINPGLTRKQVEAATQ